MVIDTSALVAIVLGEPEEGPFKDAMSRDDIRLLSAVNLFETRMVIIGRYGEAALVEFADLLDTSSIDVVAATLATAEHATDAFRRFGKGRHRAGLNFGDCFAYALAREADEPLLFKGDDFGHTDIVAAAPA